MSNQPQISASSYNKKNARNCAHLRAFQAFSEEGKEHLMGEFGRKGQNKMEKISVNEQDNLRSQVWEENEHQVSASELHQVKQTAETIHDEMEGEDQLNLQREQATGTAVMNPEEEYFGRCKQAYLAYAKAVFIIQQILDTIENEKLLDYNQESHVEFMFLVWTRVRNYLELAWKLMKEANIVPDSRSKLSNIEAYKYKSAAKFKIYNKILDEIRSKFGQKIGKLFNIKKSVTGKEKFLDGFEQLDYTIDEQVQFTYRNYIEIVLNSKEVKSQYFINYRFKKVLKGYKKICQVSSEKLAIERSVLAKFNQIITDQ